MVEVLEKKKDKSPASRTPFGVSISLCCALGIGAALMALAFLQDFLTKRIHVFEIPPTVKVEEHRLRMEEEFQVIHPRKRREAKAAVSLAALVAEHRTLIINFWATWCPPCIEELPSLEYLNRRLDIRGSLHTPILVTISVDEQPKQVGQLFSTLDFEPTLLVLSDPNGYFSRSLGTLKFPETYWIDSSGRILHKWIGPQNWLSAEVLGFINTFTAQNRQVIQRNR